MTAALDQDEDGAARAFAELRAEVTVMRKAVEALQDAIEEVRAPDYGPTLGAISQVMAGVEARLGFIEDRPAVKLTPEQHARAISQAGAEIMREASRALRDETNAVSRERQQLAGIVGTAKIQDVQKRERRVALGFGVVLGLILFPVLGTFAPGGSYLAALATGTADRWQAGAGLMRAANPVDSAALATASRLVNANTETLQACSEAARKTGKEQRCTITVAMPGQRR